MATGDSLLILRPTAAEPTATSYAQLDLVNQHPVLDFDDDTNEDAVWAAIMPQSYSGGGITCYIHYAMTSATTLTVDWDIDLERIGDQQQNLTSDGWVGVNSVDNTTVPGTAGLVDIVSIAFTSGADMDSIAAGEAFRLKLTRDAVSDDAAGDAELVMIEIRET